MGNFIVIDVFAGVAVIEGNRFLQITPLGVNDVGHIFGCIGCVGGFRGGTVISNIGIDRIFIAEVAIRFIGQIVKIILVFLIQNTILIRFPIDGAAVLGRYTGVDALIGLVVVISVGRRGLEADMGIEPFCIGIALTVDLFHRAKLVAVEGNLAGGIVDIRIVVRQLGHIDLAGGQENVGVQAHSVEHTQGGIGHFRDGGVGDTVVGIGLDLLQNDGQDLLVDLDTQGLGAVSIFRNRDADILRSIVVFVGGGIHAGGFGHSVGAVGIADDGVGSAKQGDRLDALDFHVLTDAVHIHQRRIFHTGTACHGLAAGNGVECAGDQLFIDLGEGDAQLVTGNSKVIIHIVDVGHYISGGHTGSRRQIVVKGIAAVAIATGDRFAVGPIQEQIVSIADTAAGIVVIKAVGSTGVHQSGTQAGIAQVRTDAIDDGRSAIVVFHPGAAKGSIEQGAQCDTGGAGRADGTVRNIIPVVPNSSISFAIGHDQRNRGPAGGIGSGGQHPEAAVDTGLQIGALGEAVIAAQQIVVIVSGADNTAAVSIGIMIDAEGDTVGVEIQGQHHFAVVIIGNNTDTDIADFQQILNQQVRRFDRVLQTGLAFNGVTHGSGGIKNHNHIQGTHIGIGGSGGHRGAQSGEDDLERLVILQRYLERGTGCTAGIQQSSLAIGEDGFIRPHATGIAVAVCSSTHHGFPGVGRACISYDTGRSGYCIRCIASQCDHRQIRNQQRHTQQDADDTVCHFCCVLHKGYLLNLGCVALIDSVSFSGQAGA